MGLPRWHQRTGTHVPMQETKETQVWSLDWKDPLEKETVTGSSILIWKNAMGRKAWWGRAYGVAKSWTQLNMHPNTHVQVQLKKKNVPQMKMCSCKTYPTFIATTFKISQTRNNLEPITWKNDLKNVAQSQNKILPSNKKEWAMDTWYNRDDFQKYYTK